MKIRLRIFALIFLLAIFHAKAEVEPASEILAATEAISKMEGSGYKGLFSIIEKWPRLGVLENYESTGEVEKIRGFAKSVCTDLANTLREMALSGASEEESQKKLNQLAELYNHISKKDGYTNDVLSSAVRITIRSGIFIIINKNNSDLQNAEKIIGMMNRNRHTNFNFKEWLGNAKMYDPWAKNHETYVADLPEFPSIMEVTFPLMKVREKIPNRISHVKLLDQVNSFQLGIYQYQSEFFEVCVIPFWIQYIRKEGLPEKKNSSEVPKMYTADELRGKNISQDNDTKYKAFLSTVPVHPFFGSDVSVQILRQFWYDSTGVESILEMASAIGELD